MARIVLSRRAVLDGVNLPALFISLFCVIYATVMVFSFFFFVKLGIAMLVVVCVIGLTWLMYIGIEEHFS